MTWEIYEDPREELANSITHGLGAALAAVGLGVLVHSAAGQGPTRLVSMAVFGASMVVLYLCSALYHGVAAPKVKQVLELLDHSAIYLLIAGTYTPFMLVTLQGVLGWTLFGVVWALAAGGIFMQLRYPGRFHAFMTGLYVAMGWMIVLVMKPLIEAMEPMGLVLLFAGGLSYTGGVYFYYKKRFRFSHSIWHLFVLGGTVCHFFAVFLYI